MALQESGLPPPNPPRGDSATSPAVPAVHLMFDVTEEGEPGEDAKK